MPPEKPHGPAYPRTQARDPCQEITEQLSALALGHPFCLQTETRRSFWKWSPIEQKALVFGTTTVLVALAQNSTPF